MGTWAMDGRPEDVRTPLAALRQILGDARVLYAPGLKNSRSADKAALPAALERREKLTWFCSFWARSRFFPAKLGRGHS